MCFKGAISPLSHSLVTKFDSLYTWHYEVPHCLAHYLPEWLKILLKKVENSDNTKSSKRFGQFGLPISIQSVPFCPNMCLGYICRPFWHLGRFSDIFTYCIFQHHSQFFRNKMHKTDFPYGMQKCARVWHKCYLPFLCTSGSKQPLIRPFKWGVG